MRFLKILKIIELTVCRNFKHKEEMYKIEYKNSIFHSILCIKWTKKTKNTSSKLRK